MHEEFDRRPVAKKIEVERPWNSIAYPKVEGINMVIECNGAFHRKLTYNSDTQEYTEIGDVWACDKKEHQFN